jgi:16S rRNA (adenine1518-N6/adenine1519-N6)-dimethyltransferase
MGSAELMRVVRAAFGQRRKTIRNSLIGGLEDDPAQIEEALRLSGVSAQQRAEALSLEDFARIVEALR